MEIKKKLIFSTLEIFFEVSEFSELQKKKIF